MDASQRKDPVQSRAWAFHYQALSVSFRSERLSHLASAFLMSMLAWVTDSYLGEHPLVWIRCFLLIRFGLCIFAWNGTERKRDSPLCVVRFQFVSSL